MCTQVCVCVCVCVCMCVCVCVCVRVSVCTIHIHTNTHIALNEYVEKCCNYTTILRCMCAQKLTAIAHHLYSFCVLDEVSKVHRSSLHILGESALTNACRQQGVEGN